MAALTPGPASLLATLWIPPRTPPTCIPPLYSLAPSANAALPLYPLLQTSFPPFAHFVSSLSAPSPPPLAPGCPSASPASSPPLSPTVFFNGMLEVFEPEALSCYIFSRPIPLTSSASRNAILNQLPLSGFSALRSDRTHSLSSILYRDAMHASGGIIVFVRQGLSFSELSTSFLSSLDPYSDYVDFNISLNNFPSLSFLNVYAAPIRSSPTDGKTDSFSPSILLSSTNFFILRNFNCHHPLWGSRGTFDPRGEEVFDWVISSDLPLSMTLAYQPFSIASLAVAPPLTFPLLLRLFPYSAPGRCLRIWFLITYQFFNLSLSLSFDPTSARSFSF